MSDALAMHVFESIPGWFEMNDDSLTQWNESVEGVESIPKDLERMANNLCEQALDDARSQLHPLIRNVGLERLDKRYEFVQAFKLALEERIAHKLAILQPGVQAVFQFEKAWMESREAHWATDSFFSVLIAYRFRVHFTVSCEMM